MKKYLRVILLQLKNGLSANMQYRANFFAWTIIMVSETLILALFFKIVYNFTGNINGWEYKHMLVLSGTYSIFDALMVMLFVPIMYGFSRYIVAGGDLDKFLFKPMDTLFLLTFRNPDFTDVGGLFSGIFLLVFSVTRFGINANVFNIILYIITLVSGMFIMRALIIFLISLAFKATNLGSLTRIYWELSSLSQYPVDIYKGILKTIFTFVLPIGLAVTLPAEVFFGRIDWRLMAISGVGAVVSIFLARKFFYHMLRFYEGGSN